MFSNEYQTKILISKVIDVDILDVILGKYTIPVEKKPILEFKLSMLKEGYPLDYVIGSVQCLGLQLSLNTSTLIPREETEDWLKTLASTYLVKCKGTDLLVDCGTGSGIIGLYLSRFFDKALLIDIDKVALETAKHNAKANNIVNCEFKYSDGLGEPSEFDQYLKYSKIKNWCFVANLPYLPLSDKEKAQEMHIDKEPEIALYSGEDGLDLFRKVVDQITALEKKPFRMLFELDPRNIHKAQDILKNLGYKTLIWKDFNENNRLLMGEIVVEAS
jgi:release factor glutamine methyltransferase